jgi:carboxypeptidase C (cathepsin A)
MFKTFTRLLSPKCWCVFSFLTVTVAVGPVAVAQNASNANAPGGAPSFASLPGPSTKPTTQPGDKVVVEEHESTIGGKPIRYRTTAGTMPLPDDDGKPRADIFFTAYETLPVNPKRPITFVFNGGPGAASVWLHLGTVGPKRVAIADDGGLPLPPFSYTNNDESWLDLTDLVFIDPVGTGYSRAAPGQKPDQFWGVEQDASAVSEFIRLYTTKNGRWGAAKYIAGESYGTTRAARISELLADRHGLALNGIVLVSTVLDFATLQPGPTNDLPYWLFLPSYTAIAHYHKRLPEDLQKLPLTDVLKQAEAFASGEYVAALTKGVGTLRDEQRTSIGQQLARLTGLDAKQIARRNLRIEPGYFRDALLEDRRTLIGRFDGRIEGFDTDPGSSFATQDPSFNAYLALYTAAMYAYAREELKYESTLQYEVLASLGSWDFGRGGSGPLSVSGNLRNAMVKNPALKVLVASGWYDLATPYFAADYTVNRLDLPKAARGSITQTYYPGGHMMYHVAAARKQLKEDVAKFYGAGSR